jgi:hypothetical protein
MFVGIDVAKAELVVSVVPSVERFTVANDERGVRTLVERLRPIGAQVIVLEATGGYELLAVAALVAAALPAIVVNPRQVRDFAKATGQLAKTDRIDADQDSNKSARAARTINSSFGSCNACWAAATAIRLDADPARVDSAALERRCSTPSYFEGCGRGGNSTSNGVRPIVSRNAPPCDRQFDPSTIPLGGDRDAKYANPSRIPRSRYTVSRIRCAARLAGTTPYRFDSCSSSHHAS